MKTLLVAVLIGTSSFAGTIDFGSIPNGTLLSQDNTFGPLTMTAFGAETAIAHSGAGLTLFRSDDGYFSDGVLNSAQIQLTSPPPGPPLDSPLFFNAQIAGTFSVPIYSFSLQMFVGGSDLRSISVYGIDQNGKAFTDYEDWTDETPLGFLPLTFTAPPGGDIEGFSITHHNEAGLAQVSIQDLAFTTAIPDGAWTACLLFSSTAFLSFLRKRHLR